MLDKIKQLREMKQKMDGISVSEEVGEIKIEMSGGMEILSVQIGDKQKLTENDIKECLNKAVKSVQKKMMSEMGGNLPF